MTTEPSTDYDVVVVGARPAGAATAMLLAARGVRTLVVDRAAPGTDALSTHALMRGGVLQLHRWGLLDAIVAAGTPPVRRVAFTHGGERMPVSITPRHGVDALYAPRRTVLDPLLAEAAANAGAELRYRTTLTALGWTRGRVSSARLSGPTGAVTTVTARVVVGADGLRSSVAQLVDAPVTHTGEHAASVTYGYWSDVEIEGYEWVYRRDACTGAIPTNDGQVCVFASATPSTIGRGGVDVIRRLAAAGSPELAIALGAGRAPTATRTWAPRVGFVRRPYGPGWALVGDAGYFKDPIGAHGITDALRDAELLARAIAAGIDDPEALHEALADYERTRNRLSLDAFALTDRIAANDWNDDEVQVLLRQLSSATTDEVDELAALDLEPAS